MSNIDSTKQCTPNSMCTAVNCPFLKYGDIMDCVNADQFEPYNSVPASITGKPDKTLFYAFGFDGETSTFGSSIDGINFRFPAQPPLTNFKEFQKDMCTKRGCDHDSVAHCACTEVIDINDLQYGDVVEIVMVNIDTDPTNTGGTSHPIHLHGHTFYVYGIGYPSYNSTGQFERANDDIQCILKDKSGESPCPKYFITYEGETKNQTVRYTNNKSPPLYKNCAEKDTVIVPFGGYTTIRFQVDNPGWWFFHCHIEIHQLEGMAAVIKELQDYKINKQKENQTRDQLNKQIQPDQL